MVTIHKCIIANSCYGVCIIFFAINNLLEFGMYSQINDDITYDIAITMAESESDIRITTDTTHLALTGELWGVYYEDVL